MTIPLNPELQTARDALAGKPPHLSTMLDGAVATFENTSNPLSLHLTGTAVRELIREFLADLAPDPEIKKTSWFIPDESSDSGVTRRHRVQFAIYRYLETRYFEAELIEEVEEIADDLVSVISALSKLTHMSAKTIAPSTTDATALFKRSLELFSRLAQAIQQAHAHLKTELEEALWDGLAELFISDFFDELDQLSSHTRPQDADGVEVEVTEILPDGVHFSGTGTVYCDLQYGSDGDCRRGDGAEWTDSFPFSFVGVSPLDKPFLPTVGPNDVRIDTSSYYE